MSYEKIRINGNYEYECLHISETTGNLFEVILNTDDYTSVVENLKTIEFIEILYSNDAVRERLTEFTTYSEITINKEKADPYSDVITTIRVVFKKPNIEQKVRELDIKVNNIVNIEAMTIDEYKAYKMEQLSKECRAIIEAGADVETSKGTKHFTYNHDDQFNVKTLFDSAYMVQMDVPFHSSQNSCEVYTWQDAIKIYITLESNLLYHITYCNALFMHIREDLNTKEDVAAVAYGMDVPENRIAAMNEAMEAGKNLMNAVLSRCGLANAM